MIALSCSQVGLLMDIVGFVIIAGPVLVGATGLEPATR